MTRALEIAFIVACILALAWWAVPELMALAVAVGVVG